MEAKDVQCLEPMVSSLESRQNYVRLFDPYADIVDGKRDTIRAFAEAEFPVAVVSSIGTIDTLNLIRPRDSYFCIGVEHGIAPFKAYTYSAGLLSSDFYLAPTRGWAERLTRLYPQLRAKVRVGGYPKIEVMRENLRQFAPATSSSQPPRMLVLLSWGVRQDAWKLLPDHDFIDYLLHPADWQKLDSFNFRAARVHISRPQTTYPLIADASIVLGDFSSLTLECIHLGKRVSFLIDAALYETSCDVDSCFANRESADFGRIPFADHRIEPSQALTASQFASLIESLGCDSAKWQKTVPPASIASDYLPSVDIDNRDLCASEICDVLDRSLPLASSMHDSHRSADSIENLEFLAKAYPALLHRPPDRIGLCHYLPLIGSAEEDEGCANALSLCRELNRSSEAAMNRGALSKDPVERILAIFSEEAAHDPSRVIQTLDALSDHLLPSFYRRRRKEAASDVQRIRYGEKLAATGKALADEFVELAQAYARAERLGDALSWTVKAIDNQPIDGELLRFKASILERRGEIEPALEAAENARIYGAEKVGIGVDIARLKERYAAQLRELMTSDDSSNRLVYYAKLRSIGHASIADLQLMAQASADEENLVDALFWISKAIDDRPRDGELYRFRASILERCGRTEEALDQATQARALGADERAITADILRIRGRLVDQLRQEARSSEPADRLISQGKLLRLGILQVREFAALAARIAALLCRLLFESVQRSAHPMAAPPGQLERTIN